MSATDSQVSAYLREHPEQAESFAEMLPTERRAFVAGVLEHPAGGAWSLPCETCNGELAKAFNAGQMSRFDLAHCLAHCEGDKHALLESLERTLRTFRTCIGIPAFGDFANGNPDIRAALELVGRLGGRL